MPNGYTAVLYERGQSFQDFLFGCARAFGACISLRDESTSTPIPEEFEPSPYHLQSLEQAQLGLEQFESLTDEEIENNLDAEHEARYHRWERLSLKNLAAQKRISDMITQVIDWVPPSPDHKGLKRFMLEQLELCSETLYKPDPPEKLSLSDYKESKLSSLKDGIRYHSEKWGEERERCAVRTQWVKALRDSLRETANG